MRTTCEVNGMDKVEVNVKLSKDIYDMLVKFCDLTEHDTNSFIEKIIFEIISSDLGFRANVNFQERIKTLEKYFG